MSLNISDLFNDIKDKYHYIYGSKYRFINL